MIYLFFLFAYLLGAIPFGYIFYKFKKHKDIREYGSTNIGATNVMRLSGWKLALPVAVLDILKGAVPVFLAMKLFPDPRIAYIAGLCAILGHCFPVYIGFKGGKGVATTVGAYSVIANLPLLCILGVFIATVALTRYISLGSLAAAFSFPIFAAILNGDKNLIILGIVVFLLIVQRHRHNIKRLLTKTERRLGGKK